MSKELIITKESLDALKNISNLMKVGTFHHHYHILYDIRNTIEGACIYVEIGAYAGGSAALMSSSNLKTDVISIDLGSPIDPNIVIDNVEKFKHKDNTFKYIKGDSTDIKTVNALKETLGSRKIDILFIDGNHSYSGVIADYKLYNSLVADGGYIVFDDYLDHEHSPDVKLAVDSLIDELKISYEIIGTLPNTFMARPSSLHNNNCFVIRKKINGLIA